MTYATAEVLLDLRMPSLATKPDFVELFLDAGAKMSNLHQNVIVPRMGEQICHAAEELETITVHIHRSDEEAIHDPM